MDQEQARAAVEANLKSCLFARPVSACRGRGRREVRGPKIIHQHHHAVFFRHPSASARPRCVARPPAPVPVSPSPDADCQCRSHEPLLCPLLPQPGAPALACLETTTPAPISPSPHLLLRPPSLSFHPTPPITCPPPAQRSALSAHHVACRRRRSALRSFYRCISFSSQRCRPSARCHSHHPDRILTHCASISLGAPATSKNISALSCPAGT